jgi:predicted nucleic acid-binding protein
MSPRPSGDELPPIVLDSSVAVAYVRDEPGADRIRAAIAEWAHQGRQVLVPSLFWYEVINPLARRHGYRGEDLLAAIDRIDDLSPTTIEPDRTMLLLTIDHVERYGLTAYDAHYLAIATAYGAQLATLDQALATAAYDPITFDEGHRLREHQVPYEYEVTWPRYQEAGAYLAKLRAEALVDRDGAASERLRAPVALRRSGPPAVDPQLHDVGVVPLQGVEDPPPASVDVHLL